MKLRITLIVALSVTTATFAAEEPIAVTLAVEMFEKAMKKADEPRRNLNANYQRRLKELKQEMADSGSLENTLLVQSEIDNYLENDRPKIPPTVPELRTAREKYEGAMRRIAEQERKKKSETLLAFESNLKSMVAAYTKERKIDEAVATRNRLRAIAPDLIAIRKASEPAVSKPADAIGSGTQKELRTKAVDGCEMVPAGEGYLLSGVKGDKGRMETIDEFRVPIVVRARVKTDSTNIRIYFARGLFIFNWEMRQTELRIRDPATGKRGGIPGAGKVTKDAFHDIEWAILHDSMSLKLDGELIHERKGKSRGLKSPVGIGPAFRSQIVVEKFTVEKP